MLATLFCSCQKRQPAHGAPYKWVYGNGEEVPVVKNIYEVNGSVIKQKFYYDSSFSYFEIDLKTKRGSYKTEDSLDTDSVVTVEQVSFDFLPRQLEIYKVRFLDETCLGASYFDVYLEKSLGIFAIKPTFGSWRSLRKNN